MRKGYTFKQEMNGIKIAKHYVLGPVFWIDILAIIPFFVLVGHNLKRFLSNIYTYIHIYIYILIIYNI